MTIHSVHLWRVLCVWASMYVIIIVRVSVCIILYMYFRTCHRVSCVCVCCVRVYMYDVSMKESNCRVFKCIYLRCFPPRLLISFIFSTFNLVNYLLTLYCSLYCFGGSIALRSHARYNCIIFFFFSVNRYNITGISSSSFNDNRNVVTNNIDVTGHNRN